MGVSPFKASTSALDDGMGSGLFRSMREASFSTAPNPDPYNCRLQKAESVNGYLLVQVHYPGCTTFEGTKLMLFDKGVTRAQLVKQGAIDPHFSNQSRYIHPIARFLPNERGWQMARATAQAMP